MYYQIQVVVSGISSWYFNEPLLLKPVTILICYASQLPAPDWRFSHRWRLTIARHIVLNGRQHSGLWKQFLDEMVHKKTLTKKTSFFFGSRFEIFTFRIAFTKAKTSTDGQFVQ